MRKMNNYNKRNLKKLNKFMKKSCKKSKANVRLIKQK